MFHLSLSSKREKAYAEKDWKRVISVALQQLDTDPHDIKALNDLAVAYHRQHMLEEAFQTCQKLNQLYPGKDLFRQSLDLGIRYMRYHLVLGEIQYAKGQHDEALKTFDRLKAVKGAFSDKYHYSAQIYAARGEYEQAVAEYQKMWERRPERAEKVLKAVDELVKREPAHQGAHRLQFEVYRKRGDLSRILQELEADVQRTPTPVSICRLAYYLGFEGQQPRALALIRRYDQDHPGDANLHWTIGELCADGGKLDEALQHYREAVRLNPDKQRQATDRLQRLLSRVKEEEGRTAILHELFNLNLRGGDLQGARRHLESLGAGATQHRDLKRQLEESLKTTAERYLETGDLDSGKVVLEQMLLLDPMNRECRTRLDELEGLLTERKMHEYETRLEGGRLSPQETTQVLTDLASLYLKQGQSTEKALSVYQRLARSNSPLQAEALLKLGMSFMRKGLIDLAEKEFEALLCLPVPASKQKEYLYEIASAFEDNQRPDRAQELYKRILDIDVAYKDVVTRLERISTPVVTAPSAAPPPPGGTSAPEEVLRDRYDQLIEIGAGGMGKVFRATDRVLKRAVVLKFINEEMRTDPEAVSRFIREAQAASALMHPAIVTIYDIHVKEPLFIAMEHIDGGTLRDRMKQGPLPVEEVESLAVSICDALAYAHRAGVVHRDIKPDNIMLTRAGGIKITDFGLARLAESASHMTRTGQILGTPAYMAPEQILGKDVDGRTDIYALGVMLYELLTGQLPFVGGDLAYRQVHERPVAPGVLNPKVSQWLEAIVMTALEKRPEDRYQDVEGLKRDLALQQQGH